MYLLYCDGSCFYGQLGGWAWICVGPDDRRSSGSGNVATNNTCLLELLAVIQGISALDEGANVLIHTDSEAVLHHAGGVPKSGKNSEHWTRLKKLCATHRVSFVRADGFLHLSAHHLARDAARNLTAD